MGGKFKSGFVFRYAGVTSDQCLFIEHRNVLIVFIEQRNVPTSIVLKEFKYVVYELFFLCWNNF